MSASQRSLRNSSVRGCVPCGTPPFGAHARGTRHRLLPRWLSSRTGFPAAAADRSFACFTKKLAAVKHAPCGPVLLTVDRGLEAARVRMAIPPAGTAPRLRCYGMPSGTAPCTKRGNLACNRKRDDVSRKK
jgi:hypothetical protein